MNKKGQYAYIMPDDTSETEQTYMFTPENTKFDEEIAFMVFQDAPFEGNVHDYAH